MRMVKYILKIALVAVLFMALPMRTHAENTADVESVYSGFQDISISVTASTLHVTGADGEVLNIYNLAGVCVMSFKIDSPDKRYELNLPKGCYIIKVGKVARKIAIR